MMKLTNLPSNSQVASGQRRCRLFLIVRHVRYNETLHTAREPVLFLSASSIKKNPKLVQLMCVQCSVREREGKYTLALIISSLFRERGVEGILLLHLLHRLIRHSTEQKERKKRMKSFLFWPTEKIPAHIFLFKTLYLIPLDRASHNSISQM